MEKNLHQIYQYAEDTSQWFLASIVGLKDQDGEFRQWLRDFTR